MVRADLPKVTPEVSVRIGQTFAGQGHAHTLSEMYARATLFALLANLLLALLALLMFGTACMVVVYAPADRQGLVPWIALPVSILSLGLGGFAVFRLSVTPAGVMLAGGAEANRPRLRRGAARMR